MDRQDSSECLLLAIWVDRRRANAPAGKVGRSGRLGKLTRLGRAGRSGKLGRPRRSVKTGKSGRLGKQGATQAKETEHSWHELCGAERSEAPRSGSRDGLLHPREGKSGKRWRRETTECKLFLKMCEAVSRTNSSGALPALANTGFHFCCKTNETPYIFGPTRVPRERPKRHLDRQASSESLLLAIWIDRRRANANF